MTAFDGGEARPLSADVYQQAFARQVLLSERRRTFLLACVFAAALLVLLVATFFEGAAAPALQAKFKQSFAAGAGFIVAVALYQLAVFVMLGRLLERGQSLPSALRYLNALLDTSIASAATILATAVLGPMESLQGNHILIYYFFIVLAALQLDWRLCLFTGAVAAAEYIALSQYYLSLLPPDQIGTSVVTDRGHHAARGLMFLVAGGVTGAVAAQVRRQFAESVQALEDRNRAVSIFGQHVTPAVADMLLRQPMPAAGESRYVCVMFVDIRGFTAFSEQRPAAEVMTYLNTLFGPLIESVNRHDGIVNKFLGDGFLAVFGAPVPSGQDSRNAVAAAREMLRRAAQMASEQHIPPTRLGIGLHAGQAVTGNVGSERRKEYTVIGNVVNLASRIEGLNKEFDSQLLVSEQVWSKVRDYEPQDGAADLGPVNVRGQDTPVRLFRLA